MMPQSSRTVRKRKHPSLDSECHSPKRHATQASPLRRKSPRLPLSPLKISQLTPKKPLGRGQESFPTPVCPSPFLTPPAQSPPPASSPKPASPFKPAVVTGSFYAKKKPLYLTPLERKLLNETKSPPKFTVDPYSLPIVMVRKRNAKVADKAKKMVARTSTKPTEPKPSFAIGLKSKPRIAMGATFAFFGTGKKRILPLKSTPKPAKPRLSMETTSSKSVVSPESGAAKKSIVELHPKMSQTTPSPIGNRVCVNESPNSDVPLPPARATDPEELVGDDAMGSSPCGSVVAATPEPQERAGFHSGERSPERCKTAGFFNPGDFSPGPEERAGLHPSERSPGRQERAGLHPSERSPGRQERAGLHLSERSPERCKTAGFFNPGEFSPGLEERDDFYPTESSPQPQEMASPHRPPLSSPISPRLLALKFGLTQELNVLLDRSSVPASPCSAAEVCTQEDFLPERECDGVLDLSDISPVSPTRRSSDVYSIFGSATKSSQTDLGGSVPSATKGRSLRKREPKKQDEDNQLIIDAGQKNFGAIVCSFCGMMYSTDSSEDNFQHTVFHQKLVDTTKFVGWKKERVVAFGFFGKIILVLPGDAKHAVKKAEDIRKVADNELGFQQTQLSCPSQAQTYLFVDAEGVIVGCLVAERIRKAFRVLAQPDVPKDTTQEGFLEPHRTWCCDNIPENAVCGISRIWVLAQARRKGVATRMLDTARKHFSFGHSLTKEEIAFSDPTPDGRLFASRYCQTPTFLVYNSVG